MIDYKFACVNYNNSAFTIDYIKSINKLKNLEFANIQIIIVDNNSRTEDFKNVEDFSKTFENILLIRSNENTGYFGGLNLALESANTGPLTYWIIGNNDLTFDEELLNKIFQSHAKLANDVFIIAPNIITQNNIHQNPHIIGRETRIQRIYRRVYYSNFYISLILQSVYNIIKILKGGNDRKNYDNNMKILMGYGACYILTPNFFKHFDKLDAPVFLMGEEGILANQIARAGGITMYQKELIVYHHDHSSIGKLPSKTLFDYSRISYKYYLENLTLIQ
jgi:GT2 family glycosyltransferase